MFFSRDNGPLTRLRGGLRRSGGPWRFTKRDDDLAIATVAGFYVLTIRAAARPHSTGGRDRPGAPVGSLAAVLESSPLGAGRAFRGALRRQNPPWAHVQYTCATRCVRAGSRQQAERGGAPGRTVLSP